MIQVRPRVIDVCNDQMPSLRDGGSIKDLLDVDVANAGMTSSLHV